MKFPRTIVVCTGWLLQAGFVFALERPRLSITFTNAPSNCVLSWAELEGGWVLERSPHLQPPVPWMRVSPDLYRRDGVFRFVEESAQEGSRFFRLRKVGLVVPGLTGFWPLDEAAGQWSEDGSGNDTRMTLSNTTWSPGRLGPAAVRFSGGPIGAGGSRAWIANTGYTVLPPAGQPFSISVWLSPDGWKPGWQGLIGNNASGTHGWHVALHTPGLGTNFLVFGAVGPTGVSNLTGRALLLPGQWRQLTVAHDGVATSLYLDSVLIARGGGPFVAHDGPIMFGGGMGGFDSFEGRMDDVRAYTNCLTREQISMVGHWRMDEGAGSFTADSSIQGHHARLTNAAAWGAGRNGLGLQCASNEMVIQNEDHAILPASGGSFSISWWMRPHTLPAGRSGLMSCGTINSNGWQLIVQSEASDEARLHFCSTNRGGTLDLSALVGLTNDMWTKVDLTFNGGVATAYVNGRQVQSASGAIQGSREPLVVGAVAGIPQFNGVIDELRVYNRERDAAEIGPTGRVTWETVLMNGATNIQLHAYGPPGKVLTCSLAPLYATSNGAVAIPGGSTVATYQAGGRKGPDAFAYTVSDGEFDSAPIIVSISVVQPHWLSPRGGMVEPQNGSNPDQAWAGGTAAALDAIWNTNTYYDCFFYAPGDYQTKGWKFEHRSTANPGCKHVGSGPTGPSRTRLTLVDAWDAWTEGEIFSTLAGYDRCDGFEVRHMTLDCNAASVPKYAVGEPVTLRIPLAATALVHTVTLRWADRALAGSGSWRLGRAAEFSLSAMRFGTNTHFTNYTAVTSTGAVQVITVEAEANELVLQFDRRAAGIDFYSLAEVEVSGALMSLPTATLLPGGGPSQMDAQHPIVAMVDGDPGTTWASGSEDAVEVTLPLEPGTLVNQLVLHWNCQTLAGIGRLGPASGYSIRARDENSGQQYDVPFLSHGRSPAGLESVSLGTAPSTNAIQTDRLTIVLTNRAPLVDRYSLREVTALNGFTPVELRLPVARGLSTRSELTWGLTYRTLRAFDGSADTEWVCGTQGMVGAINVIGSNLKFTDLRITGFGTKAGKECFPLGTFLLGLPYAPLRLGNVLIEDCVFAEPATNNTDGLTVMLMAAHPPDALTNAVIRRCTVAGVKSPFAYSHAMSATHVEDCFVDDCEVGVYFEPNVGDFQSLGPVVVRRNQFVNVDFGMFFLHHAGAQFDTVTYTGNEIVLSEGGGWGLSICDVCETGTSGSVTNVTVLNNIVRYSDWLPRPASQNGGIIYTDMRHAVFGNNVIALGTANSLRVRQFPAGFIPGSSSSEDCDGAIVVPPVPPTYPPSVDSLLPGYRRAWFNNRDLSGALLEVRFKNSGVDGRASQQQWPE